MRNTNDWYYFIQALDKNTCKKIRKTPNGEWKSSAINVKKDITDEERISGEKPVEGNDIISAESIQITRYKKCEFYQVH